MYNRLSLQHLVELQIPKVPLEVLGYSGHGLKNHGLKSHGAKPQLEMPSRQSLLAGP